MYGTTLHALFEDDGFRRGVLAWVAERAGKRWTASGASFAGARMARLDRIADLLETHLDLDRVGALIAEGSGAPATGWRTTGSAESAESASPPGPGEPAAETGTREAL